MAEILSITGQRGSRAALRIRSGTNNTWIPCSAVPRPICSTNESVRWPSTTTLLRLEYFLTLSNHKAAVNFIFFFICFSLSSFLDEEDLAGRFRCVILVEGIHTRLRSMRATGSAACGARRRAGRSHTGADRCRGAPRSQCTSKEEVRAGRPGSL